MKEYLEIIGNRAGSPGREGGASGYILKTVNHTILIDCGPGTVASLAKQGLIESIDAIIISHRHADHSADLTALSYHRAFPNPSDPIPLYAPTGFTKFVEALDEIFGIPTIPSLRNPIASQFDITEVTPGTPFTILGMEVDTVEAKHPVPCLSIRFRDYDFVYTADTAKTTDLIDLSQGAKLLLAEATYVTSVGRNIEEHGHMSGIEAGILGRDAGVSRLLLTHLENYDLATETYEKAAESFNAHLGVSWVGQRIALS